MPTGSVGTRSWTRDSAGSDVSANKILCRHSIAAGGRLAKLQVEERSDRLRCGADHRDEKTADLSFIRGLKSAASLKGSGGLRFSIRNRI